MFSYFLTIFTQSSSQLCSAYICNNKTMQLQNYNSLCCTKVSTTHLSSNSSSLSTLNASMCSSIYTLNSTEAKNAINVINTETNHSVMGSVIHLAATIGPFLSKSLQLSFEPLSVFIGEQIIMLKCFKYLLTIFYGEWLLSSHQHG